MTQEEKAKAYDEALERARAINNGKDVDVEAGTTTCEYIFPELKESEDELTWLTKYIEEEAYSLSIDIRDNEDCIKLKKFQKALAWLEKHGKHQSIINVPSREVILSIWDLGNEWKELTGGCISTEYGTQLEYVQKHWHESEYYLREKQSEELKEVTCTHEVETGNGNIKALVTEKVQIPKFKVGDWITNGDYTWKVIQVELLDYVLQSQNGDVVDDAIFHVDEQFHHWRLKDAKDGDILATSAGAFIYNGNNGGGCCPGCYCGINTLGNFKTGTKHHWTTIPVFPATKEQRDALMKVMDDAGYEFDFEKKELKRVDEEVNGEDYGIDGLYHAQTILEKTLGKVEGYQSDDGILSHKCAIAAVKKILFGMKRMKKILMQY